MEIEKWRSDGEFFLYLNLTISKDNSFLGYSGIMDQWLRKYCQKGGGAGWDERLKR
jgi:hypothetical protein